MKSGKEALQRRGFASDRDVASMSGMTQTELMELLSAEDAVIRTAAARCLQAGDSEVCTALLERLRVEKSLYTKIAICESLECGGLLAAGKMAAYLGRIGSNQYRKPPDRVSAKKSFPLPRDIIARSLGRMGADVFSVLRNVLLGQDVSQISEALDAAGYMAFYDRRLSSNVNALLICDVATRLADNELILWKSLMCLSGFATSESVNFLKKYADLDGIQRDEACRSLCLMQSLT